MGQKMIVDTRNDSSEMGKADEGSESDSQNLVKDGPRELLKQKIEKMQASAFERAALKNAKKFEECFLRLAQKYFDFDIGEYNTLPRKEKEELFEMVRGKVQKRMRLLLGGNGVFIGGVCYASPRCQDSKSVVVR